MKSLFLTILVIAASLQKSKAQTFTLGPKIGANFSSLNFNQSQLRLGVADTTFHYITKDAKMGLVAGVFFRISGEKFYVQPEILFAQDRTSFDISRMSLDTLVQTQQIQFNKIDIPINIGYKFAKVVRVQGGVVGTYILSKDVENLSAAYQYVTKLSTSDLTWSWQAGLGLDLGKRMTVDLKYEGNIGTTENTIQVLGQSIGLTQRKNTLQLTIGVALIPFKTK
jgi:opacity protein-like surface antigen